VFFVRFVPTDDGSIVEDEGVPPVTFIESYKLPAANLHPYTKFDMLRDVQAQDHMAWETQGPIADRSKERLATTDRGVVMLRQMVRREIERVQRGEDPKGTQRDPNHPMIDTKLTESLAEMAANRRRREQRDPSIASTR
jgi:5,5'-dehydrodivanillate O-demethylase